MNITTFETAKAGDKVWDIRLGWGSVHHINANNVYPVAVSFPKNGRLLYTIDGLYQKDDITQSLYWDEVKIKAPEKPTPVLADLPVDTKVIVWDDITPKTNRHFSHLNTSGKIMCFDHGLTSWTTEQTSAWGNWELAE